MMCELRALESTAEVQNILSRRDIMPTSVLFTPVGESIEAMQQFLPLECVDGFISFDANT